MCLLCNYLNHRQRHIGAFSVSTVEYDVQIITSSLKTIKVANLEGAQSWRLPWSLIVALLVSMATRILKQMKGRLWNVTCPTKYLFFNDMAQLCFVLSFIDCESRKEVIHGDGVSGRMAHCWGLADGAVAVNHSHNVTLLTTPRSPDLGASSRAKVLTLKNLKPSSELFGYVNS